MDKLYYKESEIRNQQKGTEKNLSRFNVVLVEATERVVLDHLEVDFVAHQVPDVVDAVLDHRRPGEEEKRVNGANIGTKDYLSVPDIT